MKKTYETPSVVASGDTVRDTKGGFGPSPDVSAITQNLAPGAIGFNL